MHTIAIANQKGGCGKTTTAINLSACLADKGKKSLLIDMDPQAHATVGINVKTNGTGLSVYDLLLRPHEFVDSLDSIINPILQNLDLIRSSVAMNAAEREMMGIPRRDDRLHDALSAAAQMYDYVIVDCPPGMGILTRNAIMACAEVIVTVETGFLALHGVGKFLQTLQEIRRKREREIKLRVVATMYDRRTVLAREVLRDLNQYFGSTLFNTVINRNIKLGEALSFGLPITAYDRRARGFTDYMALTDEIIDENESNAESEGEL